MVEQFVVGIVRGTHGIAGEFKVESTSGEYGHFADMEEVTLVYGEEKRQFKVESTREAATTLYMKLVGINTPEEAAKFNRWQIVVPRKNAHQLQKDEWYIEDLKGCLVWYKDGAAENTATVMSGLEDSDVVGTVTDVTEGGSGYLVEISLSEGCRFLSSDVKYTKGGSPRTVFVPLSYRFLGDIDVGNKRMRLMHLWILE